VDVMPLTTKEKEPERRLFISHKAKNQFTVWFKMFLTIPKGE